MTSILKITGIERGDTGRVVCVASNGVKGDIQSAASNLIVNRKCYHIEPIENVQKVSDVLQKGL